MKSTILAAILLLSFSSVSAFAELAPNGKRSTPRPRQYFWSPTAELKVSGVYFNMSDEGAGESPTLYFARHTRKAGQYEVVDTGLKTLATSVEEASGRCQMIRLPADGLAVLVADVVLTKSGVIARVYISTVDREIARSTERYDAFLKDVCQAGSSLAPLEQPLVKDLLPEAKLLFTIEK